MIWIIAFMGWIILSFAMGFVFGSLSMTEPDTIEPEDVFDTMARLERDNIKELSR